MENIDLQFSHKVAFVVATKDRPKELRTMLRSLAVQSHLPAQVVIVDASIAPNDAIIKEFPEMRIRYIRYMDKPSASAQRNRGQFAIEEEIDLVGFFDDDIEFEADSLLKMMAFWESASDELGGAAFNMVNHPELAVSSLKLSSLSEYLGLYSKKNGIVLPSGFHTMINYVNKTTFVKWLPTTAVIWKRTIFNKHKFDEWFEGYSYLEDLDFSYNVGKYYKIAVVEDARYYHYPATTGRGSSFLFGKREVLNRLYFVNKHEEFSLSKCYFALIVRMLLSLIAAIKEWQFNYIRRVAGNIIGLVQSVIILRNIRIKQ
jgi:glycosyltransferase involved in cell wall biosynthesis